VLYHIPQLRMLDGCEVLAEDKAKAENLHGVDLNDRETIFKALLPQETFVDRRVNKLELLENESEDDDAEPSSSFINISQNVSVPEVDSDSKVSLVRRYVGELIQRVEIGAHAD
jgi:hypothetical protein